MSSPKARRRQRSTRVVVAAVLVITAAVVVLGAVLTSSFPFLSAAAVLAVALGAVAARIVYSELVQSRRDAARDRAQQAQSYRELTDTRAAEHDQFVTAMRGRLDVVERSNGQLETAVISSQRRAADAIRKLGGEARRADLAETEGVRLARALDDSEERAAEAIVRVAELEQDNVVLRSELDAHSWQHDTATRRHA